MSEKGLTKGAGSKPFIGWIMIVAALLSGWFIYLYTGFNFLMLSGLLLALVLSVVFYKHYGKEHHTAARVALGLLFIFSGFVKGVDPVGTQYRIQDYFIAYGAEWAIPLSLYLSVFLNLIEFTLGILLLFNVWKRTVSWLVLVMMAVFTLTTLNDALYNPVPDCGCFGDAIVLSNWQTLYKNLAIGILVVVLVSSGNRERRSPGRTASWVVFIAGVVLFTGFQVYNIRHLPVVDFRNWKTGNNMLVENPLPRKYFLTYRNTETGEIREYLSPNYPYDDSVWVQKWEFVSQRVVDPNPRKHDLSIMDEEGTDLTDGILHNPGYQIMIISYDLSHIKTRTADKIRDLLHSCDSAGITAFFLTSALPEDVERFMESKNIGAEFYYADDTVLQAMVRSNPGFILMKDGVVVNKWHFNDMPDFKTLNGKYFTNSE